MAGETSQFTATATFDGLQQDVTNSATWRSSSADVATVSGGGLVTALDSGTTSILATYQGVTGLAVVTVIRPGGETTGRLVSALDPGRTVEGASLKVGDDIRVTLDFTGLFTLVAPRYGTYPLHVTAPSWVPRQTFVKVSGDHVDVSLIPDTFDLQFFEEMCRGIDGRVRRWAEPPVLLVETSVLSNVGKVATGEQVPGHALGEAVEMLRRALPVLSAGHFPDFRSIDYHTAARGDVYDISRAPTGAILLTWQDGMLEGFGHTASGGALTRGTVDLVVGQVSLDTRWLQPPPGWRTDYENVLIHEFGHALGYMHTRSAPSFMYEGVLMDVSGRDREAFSIFFQRPSGNQAPDIDPSDAVLNSLATYSEFVPIP